MKYPAKFHQSTRLYDPDKINHAVFQPMAVFQVPRILNHVSTQPKAALY
jgi:hypothetical protein